VAVAAVVVTADVEGAVPMMTSALTFNFRRRGVAVARSSTA